VVGAPEGCQFSPEALLKKSDLHSVFVALSTLGDWCDQKHSELELPFYNENRFLFIMNNFLNSKFRVNNNNKEDIFFYNKNYFFY
jgi:hypothetical protein